MATDAELETSLRNAVRKHVGDEGVTVNTIRAAACAELDIAEDFFKTGDWKARSKEIIQDQFGKVEEEVDQEQKEAAHTAKETEADERRKSLKRASPEDNGKSRPRKKSKVEKKEEIEESEPSDTIETEEEKQQKSRPKKGTKPATKPATNPKTSASKKSKAKLKKRASSSELSDAPSPKAKDEPKEADATAEATKDEDTSSELSSVVDDPDPPRKKSKVKNGDTKSVKPSKSTSKSRTNTEADPDSEEIKRLQGWLVKCGIRKVWGKELKPYETSKAKIKHLKSMLEEAGMTGRYSNEKAAQLKEARELAADIEAVQEGNERWGKASGDEDEDGEKEGGRPKRRLVRGAQNYDFLSSDGEETD